MKASVLLCCDSSTVLYLPQFYQALISQIKPVYEVIVCYNKEDETQVLTAIQQQFANAPFQVHYCSNQHQFDYQKYNQAMQMATGDYVLFANVKHPFTEKKVEQYSRYFDADPYIRYAFTNVEVIDGAEQVIILDYFGISGFYERWDIFKPLPKVMAKQIGFVNDFQIGITAKTVQKFLQFVQSNQLELKMRFEDFLTTFIAIRYDDTIKEIPYVLNQYRMTVDEIQYLQKNKRKLNYTPLQQVNWLNNFEQLVTTLDTNHNVLEYIELAKKFHLQRAEKHQKQQFSISTALGNYITRSYHKYSFEPLNLFQKDRGK